MPSAFQPLVLNLWQPLLCKCYIHRSAALTHTICAILCEVRDLIDMLIDAGASRAETDCSHHVCTVSTGIVSLGIDGLEDNTSNVTSLRRMLYSGNPDILTMAELLIGGRHSHSVIDCFLNRPDSPRLERLRQITRIRRHTAVKATTTVGSADESNLAFINTRVAGAQQRQRAYWANDTIALMFHCSSDALRPNQPATSGSLPRAESLLHRAYLQQMLLSTPDANVLRSLLEAGANPSARDTKGWTPDEAAAGNHEVLHRFANGHHEFDASRTSMLRLCDEWRGRRELAQLQRLCFAAGVELGGSSSVIYSLSADRWRYRATRVQHRVSPLYLLSADVAEMVASHLDMKAPSAIVYSRWVRYKAEREESTARTRMHTWLVQACGFVAGLSLPATISWQMKSSAATRSGVFLSSRELVVLGLCFGILLVVEQVWLEVVTWWKPAHSLFQCASVSTPQSDRRGPCTDGYNFGRFSKVEIWSCKERAVMGIFGLVAGVIASHARAIDVDFLMGY